MRPGSQNKLWLICHRTRVAVFWLSFLINWRTIFGLEISFMLSLYVNCHRVVINCQKMFCKIYEQIQTYLFSKICFSGLPITVYQTLDGPSLMYNMRFDNALLEQKWPIPWINNPYMSDFLPERVNWKVVIHICSRLYRQPK